MGGSSLISSGGDVGLGFEVGLGELATAWLTLGSLGNRGNPRFCERKPGSPAGTVGAVGVGGGPRGPTGAGKGGLVVLGSIPGGGFSGSESGKGGPLIG